MKFCIFKILFFILCANAFLHAQNNDEFLGKLGLFKVSSPHFLNVLAYASADNFTQINLYEPFGLKECYLHEDLRENLQKLSQILQEKALKIVFYDCFRPNSAQKIAWQKIKDERFVANPYKNGSNHSRGIAIDAGLANEKGEILPMPTKFDDFSARARSDFICKKEEKKQCENRDLLRKLMKEAGFKGIKSEWWHFEAEFKGLNKEQIRQKYPLLDMK